ncbi:PREDICTED: probable E3 ubiquitin-protein ligase XERICO [Tarenaya hassleriana]|uniref:probable E3 ubiquitin-protein ligase XERICO n=1 Tax=Tarenaya hassleriana TaxID=28532 RepID=UPI00053C90BF|nr:PREDICTED: probable E3 ubiquitin-protein ligase XERICO [Tarenaya hassleriana]XP_010551969.1 PREDICTED: probable E3 ubiquitin-protein ligase XERICO [Tarenaya hassleriana]
MGLSSLPAPSEGMLCVLLVNTASSIAIVKGIVRSILHIVGNIRLSSSSAAAAAASDPSDTYSDEAYDLRIYASECNYLDEFRSRNPPTQFKSICSCQRRSDQKCSVCLMKFEPESEINKLECGHVFHKACLEKWIDYWNNTCPLCRNPLLPQEELSSSCFW